MSLSRKRKGEPLSKSEKRLFMLCLPLVAFPLWLHYYCAEPEFPKFQPRTLPKNNAAPLYLKAAKAIIKFTPPVDPLLDDSIPLTNAQETARYSLARRQAWLKANTKTIALLQRAQKLPCVSSNGGYIGTTVCDLMRFQIVEAKIYFDQGQKKRALGAALDGVQMAADATCGTSWSGRTYEAICLRHPLRVARRIIPTLSAQDTRKTLQHLQNLESRRDSVSRVIHDWRRVNLEMMRVLMSPDSRLNNDFNWRSSYIDAATYGLDNLSGATHLANLHLVSKKSFIADMESFFKHALQEVSLPYHHITPDKPYLSVLSHELNLGYFTDAVSVTQIRFLKIELALQAYKDEHGFYPQRLTGLCPALFANLPSDPFSPSGASFKYHQTGETYTLYSIGPDQKNDGRKMNRDDWRNPQIAIDSRGDIVAGIND